MYPIYFNIIFKGIETYDQCVANILNDMNIQYIQFWGHKPGFSNLFGTFSVL